MKHWQYPILVNNKMKGCRDIKTNPTQKRHSNDIGSLKINPVWLYEVDGSLHLMFISHHHYQYLTSCQCDVIKGLLEAGLS